MMAELPSSHHHINRSQSPVAVSHLPPNIAQPFKGGFTKWPTNNNCSWTTHLIYKPQNLHVAFSLAHAMIIDRKSH